MRVIGHVTAVAALVCGLAAGTPLANASDQVLDGTYDVVGPSSTLDTWVITTHCAEAVAGCQADVHSSIGNGQAHYQGGSLWGMTFAGFVPVCLDKSVTKGAMSFQWSAKTLEGQLVSVQRGPCQMTRPGQTQTPFKLVKVDV